MSLQSILNQVARTLDRFAEGAQPTTGNPVASSGRTPQTRLWNLDRSSRSFSFGERSPREVAAFRENFSPDYLKRCDAACADAGVNRHHAWSSFMQSWSDVGDRQLGRRFEASEGHEVYRLSDSRGQDFWGEVRFVRDAANTWLIGDMKAQGDFFFAVEQMQRR